MSIQSYRPATVRPQSNWGVDLGLAQPAAGSAPVAPAAPAPVAPPKATTQPTTDWNNWSPKGTLFDHAYDAYQFSKFPLSMGGVSFWTGGSLRRSIASMISKIPNERLVVMHTRQQFMKLEGMKPDTARLLTAAYFNAASTTPGVAQTHPLQWMAQFGESGSLADWLVRGPLIVELNLHAAQIAMDQGFYPEVPNNSSLKKYGQAAGQMFPPTAPAPQAPGAPSQGGVPTPPPIRR